MAIVVNWLSNFKRIGKKTLKNFFFHEKTEISNFYTNVYLYLKPVLKNLIARHSDSVEKYTKP